MSNKPGRYQRTTGGLIAAMGVLLIATLGFVVFRDTFRNELEVTPEDIAYLDTVELLQTDQPGIVYPSSLPAEWRATSLHVEQGDVPEFRLGLLTADGTFAGLHVDDDQVRDVIRDYVDEEAMEGAEKTIAAPFCASACTWRVFTDEGGDTAYVVELEDRLVLVYGSASPADLQQLIGLLTTDPLN